MSDDRFASVVAELGPIADRFGAAGHQVYLVGGSVRDVLEGPPHTKSDFDLTTDAGPDAVEELVTPIASAVWTQGKRFGTVGCRWNGHDLEITTHRREEYDPASRKPVVRYSGEGHSGALSLYDDLERRDFTVNAMAVPLTGPLRGTLIDPHGGEADWRERVLRTPLSADVAFTDDPLRMVRAARFIATKHLRPVAELTDAAHRNRDRIDIVAVERIRSELDKLLVGAAVDEGLAFLHRTGLLARLLPDLDLGGVDPEIVFATVARVDPDLARRAAALLAWEGRPARGPWPPDDRAAASACERRMSSLRFPGTTVDAATRIVRFAGWPAQRSAWTPADARRFAAAAGSLRNDVVQFAAARASTCADRGQQTSVAGLAGVLADLATTEDLDDLGPGLDGERVMRVLDLAPGPEVGRALEHLREVRIVEGPLAGSELERRLRDWAAASGLTA